MTDYIKDLIKNLETSWVNNDCNWITFNLINKKTYNCRIDDITYINRYFLKIKTSGGSSIFININNLSSVEVV